MHNTTHNATVVALPWETR